MNKKRARIAKMSQF